MENTTATDSTNTLSSYELKNKNDGLSILLLKYGAALCCISLSSLLVAPLLLAILQASGIVQAFDATGVYIISLVFNDICVYAFPIFFSWLFLRKDFMEKNDVSIHPRKYKKYDILLFYPAMTMVAFSLSGAFKTIYEYFRSLFPLNEITDPMESIQGTTPLMTLIFIIFVCIFAPIFEEFLFRGLLLKPLRKLGDLPAVIISAAAFALYHGNLDQLVYAFAGGFFFGLLAVRANSIVPSMIMHFVSNFIVTLTTYSSGLLSGNETPTFLDSVINFIRYYGSAIEKIIFFLGFGTLVIMVLKNYFRFDNECTFLNARKKALTIITNPMMVIAAVLFVTEYLV